MTVRLYSVPTASQIAAAVDTSGRWWSQAACQGMTGGFDEAPSSAARAACGRCEVRVACIADEVLHPPDWVLGFRGGLAAPERRQLVEAAAVIVHGRGSRIDRLRDLRAKGVTVSAIAELEGASVRTIYRLLAGANTM